jgi:hypothetical protein
MGLLCDTVPQIQYARDSLGMPWDATTWVAASAAGNVAVLEFLEGSDIGNMLLGGTRVCRAAAKYGNLAALTWLHEHHASWDDDATTAAAEHGYLEALRYLHENGCPWSPWVAQGPLQTVTWMCCTICRRMAAHGTRG